MRDIADWLVGEGRLLGDGVAIAEGFALRLVDSGVPLLRLRIGQRLANPLLAAWGVIWRRDQDKPEDYVIPARRLDTSAWHGSPFQLVTEKRSSFRRRLSDLDPVKDHAALHDMAAIGGTDFLAMPMEYGDGSVQAMSLVADGEAGFLDDQISLLEDLPTPSPPPWSPSPCDAPPKVC